jgi:tRNA pseudouridine55 synthase
MNGVIILDKPAGWTSHDVVNRMRRILGQRSVGHLGTLDPLATGVLPLVTGSLTRLAQFYTASEKTYEGVMRFGFATDTYDANGEPLNERCPEESRVGIAAPSTGSGLAPGCASERRPDLNLKVLQNLSTEFLGLIEQVPPPFSAKKIQGVPAYKLARKQQAVVLKPVQVEIKELVMLEVKEDRAHFRARVSSGTYMRSIAHEMGQRLGCGAHLESLRRTAVAEFDIAQAHTLEEIEAARIQQGSAGPHNSNKNKQNVNRDDLNRDDLDRDDLNRDDLNRDNLNEDCHSDRSFAFPKGKGSAVEEPAVSSHEGISTLFIHPRQLLPQLPCVTADELTAARIRNGRPVNLPELSRARQVKVFQGQADLIAIATRIAGTLFHPKIVFPPE